MYTKAAAWASSATPIPMCNDVGFRMALKQTLKQMETNVVSDLRDMKEFPFLSEEEKTNPSTQQTWEEIRNPKLRRYPDYKEILVEELIDDHGMEGYVFRVDIDGTGPFVLNTSK
jgi:hypothetical protein